MIASDTFIEGLPKAELHMHLEGSLEPELLFALAERNGVALAWTSAEELRKAYEFDDLQSFLDLYYAGCRVLVQEQDFYEMARAYLRRARRDHVVYCELFLGLQNFTLRGIPVDTVLRGITRAFDEAERELGIFAQLMIIAQRHRAEETALELLDSILPWSDRIVAMGLGGAEVGNPPSRFLRFFRAARERGFRVVIHAGEEGPAGYVREAFELAGADRIDHGNACIDDPDLVRQIAARQTPLTLCPLSNLKLKVIPAMEAQPLRRLLAQGVRVTLNSDDPSYFGGYLNDNFKACRDAFGLTAAEVAQLARNSFTASFLDDDTKRGYLEKLDAYVSATPGSRADTGM